MRSRSFCDRLLSRQACAKEARKEKKRIIIS